jgi:hypothetical protein
MANKHLALLVGFSVGNGFKPALLVAAKRYMQCTWRKFHRHSKAGLRVLSSKE